MLTNVVDIDLCASNPCVDTAICEDRETWYKCTCKPGYTGEHCQSQNLFIWNVLHCCFVSNTLFQANLPVLIKYIYN